MRKLLLAILVLVCVPMAGEARRSSFDPAAEKDPAVTVTEGPPFCWDCVETWSYSQECGYFSWVLCESVEFGFSYCVNDPGGPCGDGAWCAVDVGGCVWYPSLSADGSGRMDALDGLSMAAVAAVLDVSEDEVALRRPCDGIILARNTSPEVGQMQRVDTFELSL
jgi:hypothetical protein